MSGKGGKRISVFDRLGPGNDEDVHTGSAHRRVSTDKASEKRHSVSGRTSSIDTTEVPCARDPLRPATNTRHRHYHTDEDFSEEDVGKTKSSRKRPPEGPTKELFSKPPDKIKSGTRGDQSSGEGGSAEPEGSEEGRKKRARLNPPDDRKEDRKDPKLAEKKEKSDRHTGMTGPSDRHTGATVPSDSTATPYTRSSDTHSRLEDKHKRHSKDDEPSDSTSSKHDRKRKRESSDDEKDGLEPKKAKIVEDSSKKKDGTEDGDDGGKKKKKDGTEGDDTSRKRKKDGGEEVKTAESESQRQLSSSDRRAATKDSEGAGGDRRRGQDTAPSGRRARERDRRGDGGATASSDSEGEGCDGQKTEWGSLPSLLSEFPLPVAVVPMERFSPAAILMSSGISPYLAGSELYQKAVEVVSTHLRTHHSILPLPVVNEPFGTLTFGSVGAAHLEARLELANTYMECGVRPGCRALTTSMDCAVRGRLKKCNAKVLLPSQAPTSWVPSGHYKTSVSLYRAAEDSTSNFKLKESVVGSVLVVR